MGRLAHAVVLIAVTMATTAAGGCGSPQRPPPRAAGRASETNLQQLLERELAGFRAETGVFVKNLATKEEAGVRADRPFNAFSVIKLALMVRAYQLADRGLLDLDERVDFRESDLRPGSGFLYVLDPGAKVTVRDLVALMILASDNSATDMVLARVGGRDALNTWLADSGFGATRLVQTALDMFRQPLVMRDAKYRSLTPEQVYAYWTHPSDISPIRMKAYAADGARLQKEVPFAGIEGKVNALWSTDPAYWFGSMTARETGRILEGIEAGTLASKASSEEMKRILLEQRLGLLRIPHHLAFPVGHKTGDGPPMIANDVGIVYAPGGPIVISFFSAGNSSPYPDHEDRIGSLSRAVVDYFQQRGEVKR